MMDRTYLKQKVIVIGFIGLILLVVGNFLPVIELSSKTIDYNKSFAFYRYEGRYILILAVFSFLLLFFKEAKASFLPMVAISVLLGYLVMNKSSVYTDCSSYKEMFYWGSGFYILLLGNILAYIAPIGMFLKEKITIKITRK